MPPSWFAPRELNADESFCVKGVPPGAYLLEAEQTSLVGATYKLQGLLSGTSSRSGCSYLKSRLVLGFHLRTAEFFDAAKYPVITFKTKRVEQSGDQTLLIADFTMHGVTKELRLPVTLSGPVKDPQGNTRIGLEAKTTLNRKDYGIQFNAAMKTGGLLVGEEVALDINAEAIKETAGATGNN